MNILSDQDRRRPHWHSIPEANRCAFHPDAIASDPLHERARLAAERFDRGEFDLDDLTALATVAANNARPLSPLPEF